MLKTHPTALRLENSPPKSAGQTNKVVTMHDCSNDQLETSPAGNVTLSARRVQLQKLTSMTAPVVVTTELDPRLEKSVYALLDSQSDILLISQKLANRLETPKKNQSLNWQPRHLISLKFPVNHWLG